MAAAHAPVEHRTQDLRGHDEAVGLRLDLDVAGEEADVKLLAEVAELLVADRLDGRRVDGFRLVEL